MIGSPASEFTNMRVPLDSVFGVAGHRMAETLFGAITPTQRMSLLGDVVADYFATAEPMLDRPVARAVEVLRTHPDRPVSTLACEVGLSERQLAVPARLATGRPRSIAECS